MIKKYLEKLDWEIKENSNTGYSLQGLNNYIVSNQTKEFWLDKVYPESISNAHRRGDFHIHDLGSLSTYCVGWDLRDLLSRGFGGVKGKIESKPPRHFGTALGQIVNFFYTLQGESSGAQAFSNFDTLLAPFVAKDGLGKSEVKQALQEFVFNLNVPTRVGFQCPFTNLTLDLKCPKTLANEAVIIGGELQKEEHSMFQYEMDIINAALFEVLSEGDAKGRVFTFPIPTVNITEDFDWNNPVLEPLWEATAKYGIPYFANFVNSDLEVEDTRSMCCRLRLSTKELHKRGGGLFGSNPLTGSIGVVTINLPKVASRVDDIENFVKEVQNLVDIAVTSLEIKRHAIEKLTNKGLFPYCTVYLDSVKQQTGNFWTNHFSTIGIVGFEESCQKLLGCSVADNAGVEFAGQLLDRLNEQLLHAQRKTGNLYNLEATPAEGAQHRLALTDGQIRYTNSTQLPVDYNGGLFAALDNQNKIQPKYTGGTVFHVLSGESNVAPNVVKNFIRQACSEYELPYLTFSPTFSVCPTHGYIGGEHKYCPDCGLDCEIYSRVVGYLSPLHRWNAGKKDEFKNRVTFDIGVE